MCEPVAMELLAGASAAQLPRVERLANGLPSLRIEQGLDFRSAAVIYRGVRSNGHTVRALSDCLIAAVAGRTGATLLHKDVDFERIGSVTGQRMDSRR